MALFGSSQLQADATPSLRCLEEVKFAQRIYGLPADRAALIWHPEHFMSRFDPRAGKLEELPVIAQFYLEASPHQAVVDLSWRFTAYMGPEAWAQCLATVQRCSVMVRSYDLAYKANMERAFAKS